MNGLGRMTKMATVPLFGKTFKAFFSRTRSIMILKPGIGLKELNAYKVCINEDTWLTLTNLKAQVSVYKTIGPLVSKAIIHFIQHYCSF